MPAPRVYLDECVDRPVSEALRARGFDVLTAIEAGRGEDLTTPSSNMRRVQGESSSPTTAPTFAVSTRLGLASGVSMAASSSFPKLRP